MKNHAEHSALEQYIYDVRPVPLEAAEVERLLNELGEDFEAALPRLTLQGSISPVGVRLMEIGYKHLCEHRSARIREYLRYRTLEEALA